MRQFAPSLTYPHGLFFKACSFEQRRFSPLVKLGLELPRGLIVSKYEYRFTTAKGVVKLASTIDVADDSTAKARAQAVFATFLDFHTLEIWRLERLVETVRRPPSKPITRPQRTPSIHFGRLPVTLSTPKLRP